MTGFGRRGGTAVALALLAWLAVGLGTAGAVERAPANDAGVERVDGATLTDGGAEKDDRERDREELTSLAAFAAGRLAPSRSAEIFVVDLEDEAAVASRRTQLRRELTSLQGRGDAPRALVMRDGGGGDADAGTSLGNTVAALLEASRAQPDGLPLAVRQAKLAILEAPLAERVNLLVTEAALVEEAARERERSRLEEEARQAEEARKRALETAASAQTSSEHDLASTRASLESIRAAQVRYRASLTDRHDELEQRAAERSTLADALSERALHAEGDAADALYDELVAQLVALRTDAVTRLDELDKIPAAPRPAAVVAPAADPTLQRAQDELTSQVERLRETAAALDAQASDDAWTAVRSLMHDEQRVNDLRVHLLSRITREKHARILGFGAEGRAQLGREVSRLKLEIRWLRVNGVAAMRSELDALRQPAELGRASVGLLAMFSVLWATLTLRRRMGEIVDALRATADRSVRRTSWTRGLRRLSSVLAAVGPELATLVGVLALELVVPAKWRGDAWAVPYTLLLWYALYRLAVNATWHLLAWGADKGDARLSSVLSERIHRSVRLVMGFAFAVAVVLAGAAAVLGRGYLYTQVVRVGWLGAIVIAYVLVRRWRGDIAEGYLRLRPSGGLSAAVERTRESSLGFFVTIAAFVALVLAWLIRAGRRFVLGFEQSRKALAYVFRRRLERRGDGRVPDDTELSADLAAFFSRPPGEDETLLVESRFAPAAALVERIAAFASGKPSDATLVVARSGYGKTTFLSYVLRALRDGVRADLVTVVRRASSADDVAGALASALGIAPVADVETLVERLRSGPRRVVAVDDAHLWFLRGASRLEAWQTFDAIVERTRERVFWIVAVAHYPWEVIAWTIGGKSSFRSVVALRPWTEHEIGELIERRNEASGLAITYDDLLVDELGITASDERTRLASTAQDYKRLVWDYAEGSPLVALHVWSRSLVPRGEGSIAVRLFARPDAAWLEQLDESTRFVLAALVWHEELTTAEVHDVLRLPFRACESGMNELLENRTLTPSVKERLRIHPLWWPQVIRYLRRKHLVET